MSKRKICVVVASRANYGRIKSVLTAIRKHPDLELQLVVGASALLYRFGNAIDVIRKDGFEPNATVYVVVEGENPTTMAKSTGMAIMELATIFENLRPDAVVTVADRYETIATAIAASYMNIPVAHTQGGEVSGSIDENVRHAVTKLSHIHFPATKLAADNIIRMGESPDRVFVTGCPSLDLAGGKDLSINGLMDKYGGTGAKLDWTNPYILVIQHPVTTEFGSGLRQINETIKAVDSVAMQTIWLWPNVDAGSDDISKGLRLWREHRNPGFVHFYRNFSPEDYLRVLNNASCIVGNSSSGLREGAFLGIPCVNIGSRQNLRERGANVMDAPYDADAIRKAITTQIAHGRYKSDYLFGDGAAGTRIADHLAKVPLSVGKTLTFHPSFGKPTP
jgi:UDP-hydrolysing UDP-N-acetyl-D-glucosamine 2-epimerase